MGNAVKFTEQGGVGVEASLVDGQLRIEVRDTGVGVAEGKRQVIFEEFVQADSSHARKFGGTGLGLAISKRLVKTMCGEIGVDGRAPGGSCFWFTLPLAAETQDSQAASMNLSDMRVAVMTANDALREGLYLQILACGGIPVDLKDGAEAVLVDAGTGAAPVAPPNTALPALVLVTPNARGSLKEMRAKGFTGYLVKPVRQSSLMTQLLLCRGGTAPAITAEFALPDIPQPRFTSGLHILLAEDNPINMMLIRELLRRRGHTVREVTTGNDAVQAVLDGDYDLLLTDIHMPGMDGIEATRAIRAGELRFGKIRTPIVALTADVLEAGKQSCLEAGMDGFLTKPVDPAELEEIFLALFSGGGASHIVAA